MNYVQQKKLLLLLLLLLRSLLFPRLLLLLLWLQLLPSLLLLPLLVLLLMHLCDVVADGLWLHVVPEMVPERVNFGSARGSKLWWCPRDGARGNFVVKHTENRLKNSWALFRGHCLGHHLGHHSAP